MSATTEFGITVLFEKRKDGWYSVRSPNLAGLHMTARDVKTMRADLEPIVKDLLRYNLEFIAQEIRWIPSLDQAMHEISRDDLSPGEQYLMITGRAA